jgi:predicted deacetylase
VATVHQHGTAHTNHVVEGRKCEFGAERSVDAVRRDLTVGRERLQTRFGDRLQPIFTPPWNRCSVETARCLGDLGIEVLSREAGAEPFNLADLVEVPVTFDWFAKRKGQPLNREDRWLRFAEQIQRNTTVGVMLHHAVTDATELDDVEALFALLASSSGAIPTTILREARRLALKS